MFILKSLSLGFINFGVGLAFLLFLLEILKPEKKKESSLYLIGFFLGFIQLRLGFLSLGNFSEEALKFPLLIFLMGSSIFTIGPLALQLAYSMLDFAVKKERMNFYHFLPAFLAFIFEFIFIFLDPGFRLTILREAFVQRKFNFFNLILFLSFFHVFSYFFYTFILFVKVNKKYKVNLYKYAYAILAATNITVLFIGIGYFSHSNILLTLGAYGISFSLILIYIFSVRYPKFFITLKNEIQQQKYKKSLLDKVNLDAVYNRIDELMNEIKIYTDEDLRMHHFAEELLITPHQLSRLLNKNYKKNFNEFINHYRVEDAKKQLTDFPKKNILSIAYDAGFNTKATFNAQFLKLTGMTPAEYRKKTLKE